MINKPEILVLDRLRPDETITRLEADFVCHHLWRVSPDERAAYIDRCAAKIRALVTTGAVGASASVVQRLPGLEIIAVSGVGVDAIPFDQTRPRGIRVTNTPDVLTDDVADLAMALILAVNKRVCMHDRYVRSGAWDRREPLAVMRSLRGKRVGIYGYGRIGQAIGRRLVPFGVELLCHQRNQSRDAAVRWLPSLKELARASDYLVVCVPGTAETLGSINADVLAALGPDGVLINIARGTVVDEVALIQALQSGGIAGAGLDVFADEPHVPQALRELDQVVLAPHVGSMTYETRLAMGQLAIDNLKAHFSGQPLLSPVI